MSFTKKLLDSVNSLTEGLTDTEGLSGISPKELAHELQHREKLRKDTNPRAPRDNPLAKLAGTGEAVRNKRKELQEKRVERYTRQAKRRDAEKKRAQEEEFQRIVEEARRTGSAGPRPSPGGGANSGRSQSKRRGPSLGKRDDLAKHYRVLNLPYGAPFTEVKSAYRKLMRKYHPDLHNQSPKKQKAANELTMQVTAAYNALEEYLEGGPNKT